MTEQKIAQQFNVVIGKIASIQNLTHGASNSGAKTMPVSVVKLVKEDADAACNEIRTLAQMIGVEY